MPRKIKRTAFFVSDGTGLTAEALGHSLMTQFEDVEFKQIRIPFLDNVAKAHDAVARINAQGEIDGMRAIVFTTLVDPELATIVHQADAFCLSYFETFLAPLEAELGVKSSHTVGRSHGTADSSDYKKRIESINYTLAHDDGITDRDLARSRRDPGRRVALRQDADLALSGHPVRPQGCQLPADSGRLRSRPPAGNPRQASQQAVRPDHPAGTPAPGFARSDAPAANTPRWRTASTKLPKRKK